MALSQFYPCPVTFLNIRIYVTSDVILGLPSSDFQATSTNISLLTSPSYGTTFRARHNLLDFTILEPLRDLYRLDH
jgi:hypothetical protein